MSPTRRATLSLAFVGVGADVALSRVQAGNEQSTRISERLGYEWVGFDRTSKPERVYNRWELRRERWKQLHQTADVQGYEPFHDWLESSLAASEGRAAPGQQR